MNSYKEHGWSVSGGWGLPTIKFQVSPFDWQLALVWSRERVAVAVGPVAVSLWYRWPSYRLLVFRVTWFARELSKRERFWIPWEGRR